VLLDDLMEVVEKISTEQWSTLPLSDSFPVSDFLLISRLKVRFLPRSPLKIKDLLGAVKTSG
jgi:hypothetical protein